MCPLILIVFAAEGDFEDFTRSGTNDFASFTLQDLRGATFFHLLLGPLLAMIIGLGSASLVRLSRGNSTSAY